ncbi:MAG: hypothetical protein ABFS46_14125 [Myxococcota bacterium]
MRPIASAVACALPLAAGCTATTFRSYDQPLAYTRFAVQEACSTAGFQLTRVEAGEVQGERPTRFGLLVGQGNEHIRMSMAESESGTEVEIVSRKRFIAFLAGRHQHERVAGYLDSYMLSNQGIRSRILGPTK